jgi:hypothetical protein
VAVAPRAFVHGWKVARANSLLMVIGAVIALIWANVSLGTYERFTHPLRERC